MAESPIEHLRPAEVGFDHAPARDRRVPSDVTVDAAEHPPCDAPAPAPGAFVDGPPVDFVHRSDDAFLEEGDLEMPFAEVSAAGVAAADFDGDGFVDLFFTQTVGPNALYWGGEAWTRAEDGAWALPDELSATVRAVDFDGDGLLDLDIAGRDSLRLLRNNGDRTFEDVTASTGILPREGWAGGAAWIDYDLDGDLDLFSAGYVKRARTFPTWTVVGTEHALWRNDGDVYVDDSAAFGFDYDGRDGGATLLAAFRDFDDDGDPDLLQVNDFGAQEGHTRPWENLGAAGWLPRLESSGLGQLHSPMGVAIADLDADGRTDLWLSDLGSTTIFRGFGAWVWTDVSLVWGGALPNDVLDASWAVLPIDLDGDGTPGVYIGYGPLPPVFRGEGAPFEPQPDRFAVRVRTGPDTYAFEDAAADVFPTPQLGTSRGAALADIDRDGVPDLVVGHVRGRPSILLGQCTDAARLVVELRDAATANRFGVGAKITVEVEERTWSDEITAGARGTFSSGEPVVFFGLADAETVDRVTIRWPDGERTELRDVPAHARLTIGRSVP